MVRPERSGRRSGCVAQAAWRGVGAPAIQEMERETGFEPATSTLARSHSTTELFPPSAQTAQFTQSAQASATVGALSWRADDARQRDNRQRRTDRAAGADDGREARTTVREVRND